MTTYSKIRRQQQGAALLLIILVLFTSISTMILAMANNQSPHLQQKFEIRNELNLAKEMLLSYAMQYPDISGTGNGPGRLPCPDIDNGEFPETSCSTTVDTFQGRLPQTLDPALGQVLTFHNSYAGIDQQFWYAVDPNFHRSAATVNSNSPASGAFSLDGAGDVVAVIIAPGEALGGQDRTSSAVDDSNYLEGGNQNGTTYFSSNPIDPDNFNDQIITISHSELMTMATNRVIQEIKKELDAYYSLSRYYRDSIPADPYDTCYSPYSWGRTYPRDFTYRGEYYYVGPNPVCIWEDEDTMFGDTYTQSAMFGAAAWYNNDAWDAITTYTNISNTQATVSFAGCGITFTFNYSGGESIISRSQAEC